MNETKFHGSYDYTSSRFNYSTIPNETSIDYYLPSELTEIADSSLLAVYAYAVVLVVAGVGHTFALSVLWKRYQVKKSRLFLLLLHLSLADMIVCGVLVPSEIFWRLCGQWEGGNFLCKATQFFRAFGLYLSSLILACLNVDRFVSIVFPLKAIGSEAYEKTKWMIATAWISAAVFSIPQVILFRVEFHPDYPNYKQCVTSSFEDEQNFNMVKIYSVFSLVIMYIAPLVIIVFTYTAIFFKLLIKSYQQRSYVQSKREIQRNSIVLTLLSPGSEDSGLPVSRFNSPFHLRSCNIAQKNLTKAKKRTMWMTIVIVIAFIVCWTPYAVMTVWYIVDWEEAMKVDPRIQDALFLMVVSNSWINPLIYGSFSLKNSGRN